MELTARDVDGGTSEERDELRGRHLLLPLAGHERGRAGLDFVSSFFSVKSDIRLTLMNVLGCQARVWEEEKCFETLNVLDQQAAKGERKASALLEQGKSVLVGAGFPAGNIEFKVARPMLGKARDIATEGRRGHYDALVLGRRTKMRIDEFLDVSLCEEMLGLSDYITCPFWVCRRHDPSLRGVLLCVDGAEPSERMADHVGYMLAEEPDQPVRVFHATRGGTAQGEEVVARAVALLEGNGVHESRIQVDLRQDSRPDKAIHRLLEEGNFAAVAAGCSGTGRGLINRFIMGSVTRSIFKEQNTTAMWCCF